MSFSWRLRLQIVTYIDRLWSRDDEICDWVYGSRENASEREDMSEAEFDEI